MIERIFVQSLDEFNYTSSVNFYKKNETETGVVCMKGLEILFYNFDKIFVISGITGEKCKELCNYLMSFIEQKSDRQIEAKAVSSVAG